jgi:hypothetical protein
MFIRIVDEGLERFLRDRVPLPEEYADVSFEVPSSTWSAQLSRITLNLFLFQVSRSVQPNRAPTRRVAEDGVAQRRTPQPMVDLSYLVSVWAGSSRDEHQLLGEVVSRIASVDALPADYLPALLTSSAQVSFADQDHAPKIRDVWSAAGGTLKASFALEVSVAADSFGWEPEAPAVTSIEGSLGGSR